MKMDDLGGYPGWGNFQAFPMKNKKPLGAREIASRYGDIGWIQMVFGIEPLGDDHC